MNEGDTENTLPNQEALKKIKSNVLSDFKKWIR